MRFRFPTKLASDQLSHTDTIEAQPILAPSA